MANYKYKVYRYRYESDDYQTYIREQRVYLDNDDNDIIPVTNTFLEAVVSLPTEQKKIKANKFNDKERLSIVTFTKDNLIKETKRYLPQNNPLKIKNLIKEIINLETVICIDYNGESKDYNKGLFQ
jgi:hypothetical protein